ncbi:MAG TPA: fatty acid--CoA ligase family protein [Ramlibacter sp.]|uniref:class I adenylate-forming enzyme family protein n=1 Tax=Ramlibacter sp. TaxID=1917967 RepID=UPI002D16C33C|nr:fatty acid--CoA ligase family protein [Ramlibacter sp.]HVZ46696.1 fatty acid--CoA ligase family protein [Ramlibacter sp.]
MTANLYEWCMARGGEGGEAGEGATAVRWQGGVLSYAELDALVNRRAATLRESGIDSQAIAALRFVSQFELALTALALMKECVPFIAIPRSQTAQLASQWIGEARATILLTDNPGRRLDATASLLVGCDSDREAASPRSAAPRGDGLAMIIGGSGSTGRSKLIPITCEQMENRVLDTIETLGLTARDVSLGLVHLEFASAMHRFLSVLKSGGSTILGDFPIAEAIDRAGREGVTVISSTAVHADMLLAQAGSARQPVLPRLRMMTIAGSTISEPLRRRVMEAITPNLWVGYGTNECWYATAATPEMIRTTPGTVGVASSRSEVRLVSDSGEPVAAGEVGLIEIRGRSVVSGYWDPGLPENGAFRDGWFRPGDLGRATADGQIVFCGRSDNMMIFNGVNIYPVEIENCLLAFPGIAEAVAFPSGDPVHQDVPVCAVVFEEGVQPDVKALAQFARKQLGFRAPRAVYLFPRLPRTTLGKVSVPEVIRITAKVALRKV